MTRCPCCHLGIWMALLFLGKSRARKRPSAYSFFLLFVIDSLINVSSLISSPKSWSVRFLYSLLQSWSSNFDCAVYARWKITPLFHNMLPMKAELSPFRWLSQFRRCGSELRTLECMMTEGRPCRREHISIMNHFNHLT